VEIVGHQANGNDLEDIWKSDWKTYPRKSAHPVQPVGFMTGWSTTDAIFILRQVQDKVLEGNSNRYCILININICSIELKWDG